MTVADWIATRTPAAPPALLARVIAALGEGAHQPVARAAAVCLETAERELGALLAARRFGREGAGDLLAVDALVTYAYEHAAESGAAVAELEQLAKSGATRLGQLTRD